MSEKLEEAQNTLKQVEAVDLELEQLLSDLGISLKKPEPKQKSKKDKKGKG